MEQYALSIERPIMRVRLHAKSVHCPKCVTVKRGRFAADRRYGCSLILESKGNVFGSRMERPKEVSRLACNLLCWIECPLRLVGTGRNV
jgi:hypothetical protein